MSTAALPLRRAISTAVGVALVLGLAAPPVLAVEPAATTIEMAPQGTPEGGVPFTATITLKQVDPPGVATSATGVATVAEGDTTLDDCMLTNGTCDVTITLATAGDHTLKVSYPGDAAFAAATADPVITVIANTVQATGVGLNYGTFYPYRDGYRDAVTARGTRIEAASVLIKVYSPTNRLLKTAPAIASATGAYAWAWNGRNASGTMYPAGKYRIEQTLNDGYMTKTWTSYVNLSAKRLYTYTKTLKQSYPGQVDYSGKGWAAWQFALPGATVYKKIVFGVEAKSRRPLGGFGPQDYTVCGPRYVGPGCTSVTKSLTTTRQWVYLRGSVSKHIKNGKARIVIWTNGGRVVPYYAKVTVTYGVLK